MPYSALSWPASQAGWLVGRPNTDHDRDSHFFHVSQKLLRNQSPSVEARAVPSVGAESEVA